MAISLPETIFSMGGWCSHHKARRLFDLVVSIKPLIVVEIRVYAGRSFIPLALGVKQNKIGSIVGIDTWSKSASIENYDTENEHYIWWNNLDHDAIFDGFKEALNNYDVNNISTYLRAPSTECSKSFENGTIDILHQDGNHSQSVSCAEIEIYSPKLKAGGLWIMDDTNWDTTAQAQAFLLEKGLTVTLKSYNLF